MKKFLFVIPMMLLLVGTAVSQDPSKDFKSAEKVIKKFDGKDGVSANDLANAIAQMNTALESDALKGDAKYLVSKAKLLNQVAEKEFLNTQMGDYTLVNPSGPIDAFNALKQAFELGDKKRQKDITYGLQDSELYLNNFGYSAYQTEDYSSAFDYYNAAYGAYQILSKLGKESRLKDEAMVNDHLFATAASGYQGGRLEDSAPIFQMLMESGKADAFVYEALYNINKDKNEEEALGYLAAGREANPDDTALLFAEINHYLTKGELDKLIGKLEMAIEKEPDNLSVYNTLGSVYDQLHTQMKKDGDEEAASNYFDKAASYYKEVLDREPNNFDATYSMGALYYNKAATYVDKLNDLSEDLSSAGMKKYDQTKSEMDAIFGEALPFFVTAEKLNGSDRNTLIALSEIYARLNDLEKSKTYKEKIEGLK